MIRTGSLQSLRSDDAVSARHHQSPAAGDRPVWATQTRENTASYPRSTGWMQKSKTLSSAGAKGLRALHPVRPSALSEKPWTRESSWIEPATYHIFHTPSA